MLIEKYKNTNDPLDEKSFNLALRIVKLYQYLTTDKKEFTLSKQLLRCGTNPGAMIHESFNAESGVDYVHKLSIGLKEAVETQYWLKLLYHSGYLNEAEFNSINADAIEVGKMLTSSIKTKKKNLAIKVTSAILLISIIFFYLH